ncbi:hypothetical protein [Priestia flexa]|uniref:hypothetical protein n=1 Tax=Priestia flexa TaxID=86664 RepID=UPI001C940FA6|nr:hypothetical protein [Priestia flexa]MBY6088503.1 hypothetical protein [Priestia flexa]
MKVIQTINDIESLKATNEISMKLIKEIEQDFLNIYEAENDEVYVLEYRLSSWQALFVLEKGDDVLAKLNNPLALEYVEKVSVDEFEYYRCAIRNEYDLQIYYSQVNTHDEVIEGWLEEHAE